MPPQIIPVAWRAPFAIDRPAYVDERPAGETVLEMVRSVPGLPADFLERGIVCVSGHEVAREHWHCIRPKPSRPGRELAVTLHYPLAGGGGGNSSAKAIGSIVAAFALVVLTAGAAGGLFAPVLGEQFAAGAIGAKVLAGAIPIVGGLVSSDLSAQ